MANDNQSTFANSMTDLMSGLAAIFFVIATLYILIAGLNVAILTKKPESKERALSVSYNNGVAEANKIRNTIGELLGLDFVDDVKIQTDSDPLVVVVLFNDQSIGFESGRYVPRGKGIDDLFSIVAKVVCPRLMEPESQDAPIDGIILEGHTDRQTVNANTARSEHYSDSCGEDVAWDDEGKKKCSFNANIGLSSKRAQAIFEILRTKLTQTSSDCVSSVDKVFVVSGRGQVEAVRPGDDPTRRIVKLKIIVRGVPGKTKGT